MLVLFRIFKSGILHTLFILLFSVTIVSANPTSTIMYPKEGTWVSDYLTDLILPNGFQVEIFDEDPDNIFKCYYDVIQSGTTVVDDRERACGKNKISLTEGEHEITYTGETMGLGEAIEPISSAVGGIFYYDWSAEDWKLYFSDPDYAKAEINNLETLTKGERYVIKLTENIEWEIPSVATVSIAPPTYGCTREGVGTCKVCVRSVDTSNRESARDCREYNIDRTPPREFSLTKDDEDNLIIECKDIRNGERMDCTEVRYALFGDGGTRICPLDRFNYKDKDLYDSNDKPKITEWRTIEREGQTIDVASACVYAIDDVNNLGFPRYSQIFEKPAEITPETDSTQTVIVPLTFGEGHTESMDYEVQLVQGLNLVSGPLTKKDLEDFGCNPGDLKSSSTQKLYTTYNKKFVRWNPQEEKFESVESSSFNEGHFVWLQNSCTIRKSINPPLEYTLTIREGPNLIGVGHLLNKILNNQNIIQNLCQRAGSIKPFRKDFDSVSNSIRPVYSKYPVITINNKKYYDLRDAEDNFILTFNPEWNNNQNLETFPTVTEIKPYVGHWLRWGGSDCTIRWKVEAQGTGSGQEIISGEVNVGIIPTP